MTGRLWPRQFDFTHYAYVFEKIDTLPVNLFNSIYVTAATVVITVFCAVLAGYALVHLRPRGGALHHRAADRVAVLPDPGGLDHHDLRDPGLARPDQQHERPDPALHHAQSRGQRADHARVFQLVPHELMDAAHIDGAGVWRTLWMVGLPLVRNGLVVVIIVNFVTAWGEYLLCTTLTNDQDVRTMPVVLAAAQGGMGQWAWPRIAAVYVIVVTPGIIAFAFAQRLFFKGLMEGVLKA